VFGMGHLQAELEHLALFVVRVSSLLSLRRPIMSSFGLTIGTERAAALQVRMFLIKHNRSHHDFSIAIYTR